MKSLDLLSTHCSPTAALSAHRPTHAAFPLLDGAALRRFHFKSSALELEDKPRRKSCDSDKQRHAVLESAQVTDLRCKMMFLLLKVWPKQPSVAFARQLPPSARGLWCTKPYRGNLGTTSSHLLERGTHWQSFGHHVTAPQNKTNRITHILPSHFFLLNLKYYSNIFYPSH